MKSSVLAQAFLLTTAVALLFAGGATAAGEKVVVYGADTSTAERQELGQFFGATASTPVDTVTTAEMVDALQGSGLPVAQTDQSISSSIITCLNKGDGLAVRTQNITRITAPVYLNALVTAGVADASILIAAPLAHAVTGETALVGVVKDLPNCQAGRPLDANRINLAYKQVAWTVALAGPTGDVNKAAAVMLQAAQPVITGAAADDGSIGNAVDAAAASQSLAVDPSLRPGLIAFLRGMAGLNYGGYAKGYRIEQASPTEVKVIPVGAVGPAGAAAPVNIGGTGQVFSGQVLQAGPPLIVRSNGQDWQLQPAPNLSVTRNGKTAQLADLHQGDSINVITSPDGATQQLAATSQDDGAGWWWRLPPLLPALLLLGILLWLLARSPRSRREQHVVGAGRATAAAPTATTR